MKTFCFWMTDRQWRWDIDKIRQSRMPTTVVALFSSKIRKLPPDLIDLLEYCACMGNTFSPAELAAIREMTLLETFEMLKPALGQGLLMENKNQLQFIHDKVQEATLVRHTATERRRQIHWQVGNHLLAADSRGRGPRKAGEPVHHCLPPQPGPGRRPGRRGTAYFLSDLNYHAGNKALDSLATEAANEYFSLSRELLPDDCWEDGHYERTFRIFQKAAKTELMCGNYGEFRKAAHRAARPRQDRSGQGGMPGRTDDIAVIHRQFHQGHRDGQPGSGLFRQGHPGRPGGGRRAKEKS